MGAGSIIGISPWLDVLELGHFEHILVAGCHIRFVKVLLGHVALGHSAGTGVPSGIREGERLGCLLEDVVFLPYHFLCIFPVEVRDNIAHWCSWPVGPSVWVSFLREVNRLIWNYFHETGQVLAVSFSESRLSSCSRGASL